MAQPRTAMRSSLIHSHVIKDHGNNIQDGNEPMKDVDNVPRDTSARPMSVNRMATSRPHFQRRSNAVSTSKHHADKTVLPLINVEHKELTVNNQTQTDTDPEIEEIVKRNEGDNQIMDRGS